MKFSILYFIFCLLCLFEFLLITWLRNFAGPINSPVYLIFTSILLAVTYYLLKSNNQIKIFPDGKNKFPRSTFFVQLLFFLIISILLFIRLYAIIHDYPINISDSSVSDIIPQTEILANRFIDGDKVYAPIEFTGYTLFPTYMPFQWMPYLICEWLHIDYRWTSALFLWLCSLYFFLRFRKNDQPVYRSVFISCWPLLIWYFLLLYDKVPFTFTLESLIAAFYLFAGINLSSSGKILKPLSFLFCLLSRYAIVLWMPLYFFIGLITKNYRKLILTACILIAGFILFYWLPFMRSDNQIFINGYNYHTTAAIGEWSHMNEKNQPVHVFNGLGLASWGYKFLPQSDVSDRLQSWQRIHLFVSLGVIILTGLIYYLKRQTISVKPYLIMSLKIYLVVFYVFIQIPYNYLFFTPLIFTAVLIGDLFSAGSQR